MYVCVLAAQSCPSLCNLMDYAVHVYSTWTRPEYWSGEPFLSPGDLPRDQSYILSQDPNSLHYEGDLIEDSATPSELSWRLDLEYP